MVENLEQQIKTRTSELTTANENLATQNKQMQQTNQKLTRAEADLRAMNERLEQQVKARTSNLNTTVTLLQQEVAERQRAETELQRLTQSLEERLVARTRELSAFFDLATLSSSKYSLPQILDPAIAHILDIGQCQAFCIHLLNGEDQTLELITHRNLSPSDAKQVQQIAVAGHFARQIARVGGHIAVADLGSSPLLPPALKLQGFQTYLGAQLRAGGRTQGWLSCYRASGEGFALDEVSLLVALSEQIGVIIENHRLRRQAEATAVLEERQRLARDLHDSVNQSLYGLTLLARSGVEAATEGDTERLRASLSELEKAAFQTLREMRLLLFQLRPLALDQRGLVEALTLRLNAIERRAGIIVAYRGNEAVDLPSEMEEELYYLAMEILNNALKHANATHITVNLTTDAAQLRLAIHDNGCGFDPERASAGLGLQNIRERAERLGARLNITSAPDAGTQVEIIVDLATVQSDSKGF